MGAICTKLTVGQFQPPAEIADKSLLSFDRILGSVDGLVVIYTACGDREELNLSLQNDPFLMLSVLLGDPCLTQRS